MEIGCGYETKTYDKLHLTEISVNWTKLLNDSDLALQFLSFSLTNDRTIMVKMYNEMLKTVNKTQLAHRLSTKVIKTMKNKLKPFKKRHFKKTSFKKTHVRACCKMPEV